MIKREPNLTRIHAFITLVSCHISKNKIANGTKINLKKKAEDQSFSIPTAILAFANMLSKQSQHNNQINYCSRRGLTSLKERFTYTCICKESRFQFSPLES